MTRAGLKEEEDAAELRLKILAFEARYAKRRLAGFQRRFLLERGWRQNDPERPSSTWIEPGRHNNNVSFGMTFALQIQKGGGA